MVTFIDAESRMGWPGAGGKGKWVLVFGDRVSVGENEKVLEGVVLMVAQQCKCG